MSQGSQKIIYIHSIGLLAPGMPSWQESQAVLRGDAQWQRDDIVRHKPQLLPPNERRRATDAARLVFKTSEEALQAFNNETLAEQLAAVFASSGGDYQVINNICTSLSKPERDVSPTQFHNSVHNAPAGYWSIATGSRAPSCSLSAFDYSFIAGLLEASLLLKEEPRVMLSCYDSQPSFPLCESRKISEPFSVSFILGSAPLENDCGRIVIRSVAESDDAMQESCSDTLESLRQSNPAARALPLLESLAKMQNEVITFSMAGGGFANIETVFD